MGYRYYDWQCPVGHRFAGLLWVPVGEEPASQTRLDCEQCEDSVQCDRLISAPAQYMGERPWFPRVAGGRFDTLGQKPVRELPEPPREYLRDGQAMRDHFKSSEWKDAKAQRASQDADNAQRRKRAALAAEGKSFNLRRSEDRLPGDPKL